MYGKFSKMGICLIVKSGGGIDTSSATATVDKILNGYTIYKDDNKITGSMTSVGKQTVTGLNTGGSTTITAGWHDGTGSVTTNSLSSQTGGTSISASDVLNSYTYWSSGSKGTGTMTNHGTKAWTIGVNGEQKIESGWHNGSGTVKQSSTVTTSSEWKLMRPTTSNQTLCNSGWYYSQNRWCEGASTLTAANIKSGVSIFGVAGTCTTRYYLIKNGQLQTSVKYGFVGGGGMNGSVESIDTGASAHYDSSLGAFVMYSHKGQFTFPVFTNLDYPILNSTSSQTGKVYIDFMCVNPIHWAADTPSSPSRASANVEYNYMWAISRFTAGNTSTGWLEAGKRYIESTYTITNSLSWSVATTKTSLGVKYGHSTINDSGSVVETRAYNVWVETTESISK